MIGADPASGTTDAIVVAIPAEARYLRLARMAAAALAGDLGFSLQEVEDTRVAVDELCAAVVQHIRNPSTHISLGFICDPGRLTVTGRAPADGDETEFRLHPVARGVLRTVAADYDVSIDDGEIHFRVDMRGGTAKS